MSARKIKPGVSISPEVWEKFKKAYPGNTSKKLEELMKEASESKEVPEYFNAAASAKFSFEEASNWNIEWHNDSMVVNSTLSYSSDGTDNSVKSYVVRIDNEGGKNG
jgi:hypothetical protein